VDARPLPPSRSSSSSVGQLTLVAAVGPAIRTRDDEQTMRLIARRFGIGSIVALAVVVAAPS
jgi:hypothetical protein